MAITITLPEEIESKLQRRAETQHRSIEELALDILNDALQQEESVHSLDDVVARIQATPPNPRSIRTAQGSLAEALRSAPEDSDFDLATWKRDWAAVEAEMKAVTRTDDITEGRR
ncbi:MAG: Arc family DNA-binding protein [Ardenticatenaceae bacterium]|nr:Arc family DNA-binding protein [Ardenticatenaceae bacterium]